MVPVMKYLRGRGWTCIEYASPESSVKRFLSDIKFQFLYARCSAVIVTDNFDPMYAHAPRKGSGNIQLWHACGAFKKFGYSTIDGDWGGDKRLWKLFPRHNTYTDVFVSAEKIIPCYAEAFNCDESIVKALGTPRTDVFFDEDFVKSGRERVNVSTFSEAVSSKASAPFLNITKVPITMFKRIIGTQIAEIF